MSFAVIEVVQPVSVSSVLIFTADKVGFADAAIVFETVGYAEPFAIFQTSTTADPAVKSEALQPLIRQPTRVPATGH